jgi:gamma-glutamyltranspeptidase / glutathione hydrolase
MREPALAPARVVRGTRGAVASPHHLATQAGVAILGAGGSAVDAAIATNAALAVVSGHSCGLGGDAFWLIWDPAAGRALALNGSGGAGSHATIDEAHRSGLREMPERGAWSVTVPGAVDSWAEAHARAGRLPWAALLAPAIELATSGFPASDGWVTAIERSAAIFGTNGDWARTYRPYGRPPGIGSVVRLPALAATLRRIADEGPDVAYRGALGRRSAAYLREAGAPIDPVDFERFRSTWVEPIAIDYRGARAVSHPPNSCGVVALQTLGILSRRPPPSRDAYDGRGWSDVDWIHLGVETSRLTLAERDRWVADPDAMADGALEAMLSDDRIDELAARLDPERVAAPTPATLPAGGGTVYITTADADGSLVSLLESNFMGFGSGLVDPETGIAFHNRGAFFRLDPAHANALVPGRRPTHTLAPGLLLRDGRPWIAHGSMGGEIQPQVYAQFVSAVVDGGADIATAIAAPRWAARMPGHLEPPTITQLEHRFVPALAERLAARGHAIELIEPWSSEMGHAHAIEVVGAGSPDENRSLAAVADPRSEGSAAAV